MKITLGSFKFFPKFTEIFESQYAPPVSTTPAANLPLVSTTPVVNLPPVARTLMANNGNVIRMLKP
jgi:hypothetical protein